MSRKTAKNDVLPEGWRQVRLGEIYNISASGDFDAKESSRTQNEKHPYPVYSNALTNKGLHSYSTYSRYDEDSITITARGDIGFANHRKTKFMAIGRLLVLKNKIPVSNEFICEYINHSIRFFKETTGVPQLTAPQASKYYITLPPFPEQKAIASLLEKWDEAIEKTEALIAAKEKQFKWMLKRLISDQQDNPEWRKVKLGEICKISKGQQLNKLQMIQTGKYPALNGGVSPSGNTDKWNTPANTVTISEGGNSCGYVNFIAQKFWAGGHCYILSHLADGVYTRFLYYTLKDREPLIMKLRVGSGLPNIQKGDVERLSLIFPSLTIQKQIAKILNNAKQEILLLEQLAEQYRTQKRGLMQKLLTGDWRITLSFPQQRESMKASRPNNLSCP